MFTETASPDAFLGGEIVNPLEREIIVSQNSTPIATIKLDENNRFNYYLPDLKPGLYSITHGHESQIVYMEPGDSTMVYANTLEFDESLHFSGRGAEKNNFLIDMFLLNEKNNNFILSYYKIAPENFLEKADSIRDMRQKELKKLKKKHAFSEGFMKLANISIEYEHFDLIERYTYLINKYYPHLAQNFPENFHGYRSHIDFDNKALENHYGYLRLIDNYLKNISIESCPNIDDVNCRDSYSYSNIRHRISLIDSLTTNPNLKKRYFSRLGAQGILCTANNSQMNSILKVLEEEEISGEKMESMKTLASIQKIYFPGGTLPQVKLIDRKNNEVIIKDLIKKPTVFFNWSMYSPTQFQKGRETIENMRLKFPEVDFMGINIDSGEPMVWKKYINKNFPQLETEFQLQEGYHIKDEKFLGYFLNKLLFVNEKGKVVMGNVKLNSPQLEEKIVEFLNVKEETQLVSMLW